MLFLISSSNLNQAVTETGKVFNLSKGSNYKESRGDSQTVLSIILNGIPGGW